MHQLSVRVRGGARLHAHTKTVHTIANQLNKLHVLLTNLINITFTVGITQSCQNYYCLRMFHLWT